MQPDDIQTSQSFAAAVAAAAARGEDADTARGEPISDIKKSRYKHRR